MAHHRLMLVCLLAAIAVSYGCKRQTRATQTPTTQPAPGPATIASFTTNAVSTSKGHGGVILTGTVNQGTLERRDRVVVHTTTGPVECKIERIESTDGGYADLPRAIQGQNVSLFFPQITPAQVDQGTRVTIDAP
jgi:hypothetical protein